MVYHRSVWVIITQVVLNSYPEYPSALFSLLHCGYSLLISLVIQAQLNVEVAAGSMQDVFRHMCTKERWPEALSALLSTGQYV